MAFAGSPFQYQPAKAAGSCCQMWVGSTCPPPRALGPAGGGPEAPAPCPPLQQAWAPLEWSQGWGRRPAAAGSPSLPALPPPPGPGRLSRSLRNVTRPGVQGGQEASAPACQLSLGPKHSSPLAGVAGGRGHGQPRGQENQLCRSSSLTASTFPRGQPGPLIRLSAKRGQRWSQTLPGEGDGDHRNAAASESSPGERMGSHIRNPTRPEDNPSPARAQCPPSGLRLSLGQTLQLGLPRPCWRSGRPAWSLQPGQGPATDQVTTLEPDLPVGRPSRTGQSRLCPPPGRGGSGGVSHRAACWEYTSTRKPPRLPATPGWAECGPTSCP